MSDLDHCLVIFSHCRILFERRGGFRLDVCKLYPGAESGVKCSPRVFKHRLVSLREMIDNKGQIVGIMTRQTLQVKQVSQCTYM